MNQRSYIIYVDESGDHGLANVDTSYPVFVLAFCIFRQDHYVEQAVPALIRLKFKHFGHDQILLHEREIRKAKHPFQFLQLPDRRKAFMTDLTELMTAAPFTLIASVIHKDRLRQQYKHPAHPYEFALELGIERVASFLARRGQRDALTHMVFESRGKREDGELELEFRRICDGQNYRQKKYPFEIRFADKRSNS